MRYVNGHTRSGFFRAVRLPALLILALALFSLLTKPLTAIAYEVSIIAQQSPYGPPQTEIDLLPWAGPFASFPLWTQAALASTVVVGAFFFVPLVARRIWGMFAGPDRGGS